MQRAVFPSISDLQVTKGNDGASSSVMSMLCLTMNTAILMRHGLDDAGFARGEQARLPTRPEISNAPGPKQIPIAAGCVRLNVLFAHFPLLVRTLGKIELPLGSPLFWPRSNLCCCLLEGAAMLWHAHSRRHSRTAAGGRSVGAGSRRRIAW